jgi:hypothetical protein
MMKEFREKVFIEVEDRLSHGVYNQIKATIKVCLMLQSQIKYYTWVRLETVVRDRVDGRVKLKIIMEANRRREALS